MLKIRHVAFLFFVALTLTVTRSAIAARGNAIDATESCNDPLGCVTVAPGDPIRIGYALAVSGPLESLGIDARRGIEIAIDKKHTVMGRSIELIGEDSGCSSEKGQTAAQKLAADLTISAVIGTSCSGAAMSAAPILSNAGMVMISPSATSSSLTDPDIHSAGFLRTSYNEKVQGQVMARYAYTRLDVRKAATIHDGSAYADKLQQAFADVFTELGGDIVAQETVRWDDTDMRPTLTKIAAHKPDFLYYPVFVSDGSLITRQAKEVSGLENAILAGADGMLIHSFLEAAGDAAEGMYLTSVDLNWSGSEYDALLARYQELYGEPPISAFHAQAYDAANMIFAAIEKTAIIDGGGNLVIGRQALRDALFGARNYFGITGVLSCDEYGDCADPVITMQQVTEGQFEVIDHLPVYLRTQKIYLPLIGR